MFKDKYIIKVILHIYVNVSLKGYCHGFYLILLSCFSVSSLPQLLELNHRTLSSDVDT